ELAKCDDNGLGNAVFDLTSLQAIITNGDSATSISGYYNDPALKNEVTDPKNFEKTNTGDQIVYAKGTNSKFTCSETAQITLKTVQSSQNLISLPSPIIKQFSGGKNSIELITTSTTTNYEFSIDGTNYQNNSLFTSVAKGNYVAYIRNAATCEYATYPFTILDYPTFFTPNGDGLNDVWKINDMIDFPDAIVYIFDRYGKLLKQINKDSIGWNGTLNNLPLPADDYWFRLVLNDNQIVNGHFSLKR
nr:T9SS type B sorting domain-containing protein [Crocinitomicaceae bacterium]